MRIAVFSYGLPVPGVKRGGIEVVAHELADGLGRRGHQVTVWTYDPRPITANYQVQCLPGKRVFETWLGQRLLMGYVGNLVALMPTYGAVDVIIAHGDSLLLPLKGLPVLRVMHGSALGELLSARTPWRFVMQLGVYIQELLTSIASSACVANSHNTTRYNPFLRRIIPLGVNLAEFFPDLANKTTEPSLLFVGSLDGRKRGRVLIEWFRRYIRPEHPNANLYMVTPQGPPVDGVTYYTGIARRELAVLYRRAWVYASPSTYEGFGLPYVEAMASGTPVVATPNPGSNEVLDYGSFGRLASDATFAQCINALLSDTVVRQALAAKGLKRAQQYCLTNMVESYEKLLLQLCAQNGGQRFLRT